AEWAVAVRRVSRHLLALRVAAANALSVVVRGGGEAMNSSPVQEAVAKDEPAEPSSPLKLDGFLPHRLNVLSSLVSQALTRVYGQYGIGIPEWRGPVTPGPYGVMTGKAVRGRTPPHKTQGSRAAAPPGPRPTLAPPRP